MKMLVVFLLPALGWSPTEGKHVSRCELWVHLKNATCNSTMRNVDDLLAQIVCKTEVSTGFDTSAVKELVLGPGHSSGHHPPKHRGRRSPAKPSSQNKPTPNACTLHGIFQLASHQACDDGVNPSANICGTSCSKLQDENVHDDIRCLLNVTTTVGYVSAEQDVLTGIGPNILGLDRFFGVKTWEVRGGEMKQVMEKRCEKVQALTYFSKCS